MENFYILLCGGTVGEQPGVREREEGGGHCQGQGGNRAGQGGGEDKVNSSK